MRKRANRISAVSNTIFLLINGKEMMMDPVRRYTNPNPFSELSKKGVRKRNMNPSEGNALSNRVKYFLAINKFMIA